MTCQTLPQHQPDRPGSMLMVNQLLAPLTTSAMVIQPHIWETTWNLTQRNNLIWSWKNCICILKSVRVILLALVPYQCPSGALMSLEPRRKKLQKNSSVQIWCTMKTQPQVSLKSGSPQTVYCVATLDTSGWTFCRVVSRQLLGCSYTRVLNIIDAEGKADIASTVVK